jgi:catechol 2,3-dioxygenase-like lactoylglutathione lyase family enzyme
MPVPSIVGVHHIKLPVTDLSRSRQWYERVLGLRVVGDFPDEDGTVRGLVGLLLGGASPVAVALRVHESAAAGIRGFDPVGLAVTDRQSLEAWAAWLDEVTVAHTPIRENSLGWTLDIPDPDGTVLRLCTVAEHGQDLTGRPGYLRPVADVQAPS